MRLTMPGQDFEFQFCSECEYYGEPNGCNNPDICEKFDYFMDVADRLQKYEDLFEKWGIDKFDAQQLDDWHDRMIWHVKKCDELGEKLHKYEHLEEIDQLITLPVALGDTVYKIENAKGCRRITPYVVDLFLVSSFDCTARLVDGYGHALYVDTKLFGKSIFYTREQAKIALKDENNEL